MPLKPFLVGLNSTIAYFKKVVLVCVVFFVALSLFSFFRGMDSKSQSANQLQTKKEADKKRAKLYSELSEKKDIEYNEQDMSVRRLYRWSLCATVGELCTSNLSEASLYKKDSLSSKMASLIVMPLKTPPSSFIYVARDTLENAGLVPKTYAAGIGFYALSSFQPIWKAFRDLAYLVIVLVILVVGFMVMFGVGGGGKTGVNLESALPRLVIALLAIAFSYAIAGLLIDVMYISILLVVSLLGGQAGMSLPEQGKLAGQIITGTPTDLFMQMVFGMGKTEGNYWNLATSLYNIVPSSMQFAIDGIANVLFGTILGTALSTKFPTIGMRDVTSNPAAWVGAWGKIAGSVVGPIGKLQGWLESASKSGGGVMGVSTISLLINIVISLVVQTFLGPLITKAIISFILVLSMIYVAFRVFFALLWIYIDILLSILFAPVLLMFEAIPGQNAVVKWVKSLAINLSVFPFFTALILVIRIIMSNGTSSSMWAPPFVAQISDQLSLQMVIGGILLYSIPQLLKTYRQKLGGESMLGSLNLGVGAMFVGAAPLTKGVTTMLGASGISGALAKKMTAPMAKAVGLNTAQVVEVLPTAGGSKP